MAGEGRRPARRGRSGPWRGRDRRPRRVCGRYVHARSGLYPSADHATGAGRLLGRRQGGRGPAGGQEHVGGVPCPEGGWVSVDALSTLPPREFANGMAEVLKYGFIMAPEILEMDARRDTETVVRRCIECKKEVVEADEMETTGRRAILNFGHTVGHALERETGYRELLHGEAISVGMVVEAGLGERLGMAPEGTRAAVSARLEAEGLPIAHPALKEAGRLIAQMRRDKKAARGNLAFSLLRGIGSCEFVPNVPEADVLAALSH